MTHCPVCWLYRNLPLLLPSSPKRCTLAVQRQHRTVMSSARIRACRTSCSKTAVVLWSPSSSCYSCPALRFALPCFHFSDKLPTQPDFMNHASFDQLQHPTQPDFMHHASFDQQESQHGFMNHATPPPALGHLSNPGRPWGQEIMTQAFGHSSMTPGDPLRYFADLASPSIEVGSGAWFPRSTWRNSVPRAERI